MIALIAVAICADQKSPI